MPPVSAKDVFLFLAKYALEQLASSGIVKAGVTLALHELKGEIAGGVESFASDEIKAWLAAHPPPDTGNPRDDAGLP